MKTWRFVTFQSPEKQALLVIRLTMRVYILLTFLVISFASFSQDSDSTSFDSSYRLIDFPKDKKMADTNIQFIVTENEPVEWIRRPSSGSDYSLGSNYDSTHNVDPKVAALIAVSFLLFILYIVFRVWRSLKRDKTQDNKK